jgi:hypothetical protein
VRYELFDLSRDRSESHDLSAERPAVVTDLLRQLERRLEEWQALWPEDAQGKSLDESHLIYPPDPAASRAVTGH